MAVVFGFAFVLTAFILSRFGVPTESVRATAGERTPRQIRRQKLIDLVCEDDCPDVAYPQDFLINETVNREMLEARNPVNPYEPPPQ